VSTLRGLSSELDRFLTELRRALSIEGLDSLVAQSEVREEGGVRVVVKRFTKEVGLLKWLPPAVFLRASYPYALSPRERFGREVRFMTFQGWEGFRVPRVLSFDEEELVIVREYVDGRYLDCGGLEDVVRLGSVLAESHRKGFSLGDVKPTNFLVSGGSTYVIDAEQSTQFREELGSWDIAVATFFIALLNIARVREFGEYYAAFSEAYVGGGGSISSYCDLLSPRNAVMLAFIPLTHLVTVVEVQKGFCR
jgi:tRNA A-37 threonylcarbamoyl transferase component Bud32